MNAKIFKGPRWLFLVLFLFLFFYSWNVYWGGHRWKGFFLADSNGYYAYLPATFIYHDLTFSFVEDVHKKSFPERDNFDFRVQQKGVIIDKWYCGTALAILPFFAAGHALSVINNADSDGYNIWYAGAGSMAAITYCIIGLMALYQVLSRFFKKRGLINLLIILILFGSNLFYYCTSEPFMSHVYSFAFINLLVLCVLHFMESGSRRLLILSFAFLALIVLIRPVNGLCIFAFPLLAASRADFILFLKRIFSRWKTLIVSVAVFFGILFIQLVYYKLQTGSFFVYSYGDERMDLLKPHMLGFLFSYKKGLFVYLPLMLLSLTGLPFLYRSNRWRFYSTSIFMLLLVYVFSSWWNWWYGGSFGTRPLIEYFFLFSILLGFAMDGLTGWYKKGLVTLCFLALILCQVQTYQYRYYLIHWDKMTKDRYWKVFMRIDMLVDKVNPNRDLLYDPSAE